MLGPINEVFSIVRKGIRFHPEVGSKQAWVCVSELC
jgi:hypothetical protein